MTINYQPDEKDLKRFRPIPFYFITTTNPEELSYESAYDALSQLKEQGFGGIVLFNKPPHGFSAEEYLSDAWFSMVRNFAKAASELELRIWINDGFDFPPGSVGGRINPDKYPHLKQKRLVLRGNDIAVEEVDWGFPAFEEPESAELFHQLVYEAYLKEVGTYFGNTIQGFFSDADNRRVNFLVYPENSPQRNYFPWSTNFAQSFEKEYGYDIEPYLVSILKKEPCSQARDYWEHAGHLYQGWFASNYKWCREHGLEYTFHTSDSSPFAWEDAPRCSLYTEGRALDMESNSDYPGTDQELLEMNGGKHMREEEFWKPYASWGGDSSFIRNPEYYRVYGDLRAKQAGSTAFLYHKKGAMCEMFAATNWGVAPVDLREIAAWQIMQGITFIVPHAYHHRLLGETKYFAPPIFSPHSNMRYYAKELNDTLAKNCYYASLGRMKAPVAVLDISDDIWEGWKDSSAFFEVCEELNRMPYGYVIADMKSIIANKDEISVVVHTGAPLKENQKQILAQLHISVVEANELERLSELIDCGVSYTGEGAPHFMRRSLDNGDELVIVANIESGKEIQGILCVEDCNYEITLQRGEMRFFTRNGELSKDITPDSTSNVLNFPAEVPIIWDQENVIPLEYWKNADGKTVAKHMHQGDISFTYEVSDADVHGLTLCLSARHMECVKSITIDGHQLTDGKQVRVFDDVYYSYDLSLGELPGEHTITLHVQRMLGETDRILLQGEFGVDVQCEDAYAVHSSGSQYNLDKYLPNDAKVTLYKRPTSLCMTESWCAQGHPFYSGKATYCLSLKGIGDCKKGVICIPEVHDGCSVVVDNEEIGKRCFAPYHFSVENLSEEQKLEIVVYNSMGNAMEFYQAPSGITNGVFLCM